MTNKTLDITEIQKILPHRYPMLLIDQVDELIPCRPRKSSCSTSG